MKYLPFNLLVFATLSTSCALQTKLANEAVDSSLMFEEQGKQVFHKDAKNRKGWDAPIIADLDQDGYDDILINDHGYGLRVMWNEQGKFSFPYDILMGDLHGVSIGDLDFDNQLELIVSRGGGSGSNARNSKIYTVSKAREFTQWNDFDEPLALMRGRTVKFVDLDNDGDLDLINFAFPSQEKRKKQQSENYVYQNDGKGGLTLKTTIPSVHADGQKTLLTDFNDDSIIDLVLYGHGNVKVYEGGKDFSYQDVTQQVLPKDIKDVTGIVELDYDNDGDFDLFFSRGLEFEKGETFYDSEREVLGVYTKRGDFNFGDISIGETLHIENFQAPWPEKLPYIGEPGYKLSYPGETHSGRTIELVSSDGLGFPDSIKGKKGVYLGYVGNKKWRVAGNMFSPFTAIIHGVKEYPNYENRAGLQDLMLENRGGKFVDVTDELGFGEAEHSNGVIVGDFDNNGFTDLVVIRRGELVNANTALVYLNNAAVSMEKEKQVNLKTARKFELALNHGIVSQELGATGFSGDVIDFNGDGKLDVVTGNERGQWHLFKNNGQFANNYTVVSLPVNRLNKASSLGAVVKVSACGFSQIKRVGSNGSAYGLSFAQNIHFGLGRCNESAQVSVTWSNGENEIKQAAANTIVSF